MTLIEVLIAMVIVAILASLAVPAYTEHVRRGRRAAAQVMLVQAAQWLERSYTENGRYDRDASGSPVALPAALRSVEREPGTPLYRVDFGVAPPDATHFRLQATPVNGMLGDRCGTLWINQAGERGIDQASSGTSLRDCWSR